MDGNLTPQVVFEDGEWVDQDADVFARWDIDPEFRFTSEVQFLQAVEALAEQRRVLLRQAKETMRYIKAAIAATEDLPLAERSHPQAIINHTGLARATVYGILQEVGAFDPTGEIAAQAPAEAD